MDLNSRLVLSFMICPAPIQLGFCNLRFGLKSQGSGYSSNGVSRHGDHEFGDQSNAKQILQKRDCFVFLWLVTICRTEANKAIYDYEHLFPSSCNHKSREFLFSNKVHYRLFSPSPSHLILPSRWSNRTCFRVVP